MQEITYTAFKTPIEIVEPTIDRISFGYNAMEARNIMYYGSTASDKVTRPFRKYYSADGSMEIKATFGPGHTSTPIDVEFITYLDGDAYSAPLVVKSNGTTQNYFYLQGDYQGSLIAITDSNDNVVEKRLFDPWGAVLKVQDGSNNNLSKMTFSDRGYTGHEHLQSVGLINMNARLYDAKLHRFLSPDKYVQDPSNTQNYNRYSYCVNNPTKYTDITGNAYEVGGALIIGAAVALVTYFATNLYFGSPITLKGAIVTTFIGAVSGAVTFGIGTYAETIGNKFGTILELNKSNGADFVELSRTDAVSSFNIDVSRSYNNANTVGNQMLNGNPSVITYDNGGVMHTVGINKVTITQTTNSRGVISLQTTIQVMNPLNSTYQNLPLSSFNNGVIRTVYFN